MTLVHRQPHKSSHRPLPVELDRLSSRLREITFARGVEHPCFREILDRRELDCEALRKEPGFSGGVLLQRHEIKRVYRKLFSQIDHHRRIRIFTGDSHSPAADPRFQPDLAVDGQRVQLML